MNDREPESTERVVQQPSLPRPRQVQGMRHRRRPVLTSHAWISPVALHGGSCNTPATTPPSLRMGSFPGRPRGDGGGLGHGLSG